MLCFSHPKVVLFNYHLVFIVSYFILFYCYRYFYFILFFYCYFWVQGPNTRPIGPFPFQPKNAPGPSSQAKLRPARQACSRCSPPAWWPFLPCPTSPHMFQQRSRLTGAKLTRLVFLPPNCIHAHKRNKPLSRNKLTLQFSGVHC